MSLPVVDVGELAAGGDPSPAAQGIRDACLEHGFFYVVGHGVPPHLTARLERSARRFFQLDTTEKLEIRMARGGRAWRGYFPVGEELTSGRPDLKEGLYFGQELPPSDPRVEAGTPLHGPNLFPARPVELRETVLQYLDRLTELGHALMRGVAVSLDLDERYFADGAMRDPLMLFRIFHYPPSPAGREDQWGVGEHTDYGVLTILRQDEVGGLQVRTPRGWIDAPPVADAFVCNIGDMLELMTGGLYRSTPHRVLNASGRSRMSFPFFFDPGFDAAVEPIPGLVRGSAERGPDGVAGVDRWDGADPLAFQGTYGAYVLAKVSKVFPELAGEV